MACEARHVMRAQICQCVFMCTCMQVGPVGPKTQATPDPSTADRAGAPPGAPGNYKIVAGSGMRLRPSRRGPPPTQPCTTPSEPAKPHTAADQQPASAAGPDTRPTRRAQQSSLYAHTPASGATAMHASLISTTSVDVWPPASRSGSVRSSAEVAAAPDAVFPPQNCAQRAQQAIRGDERTSMSTHATSDDFHEAIRCPAPLRSRPTSNALTRNYALQFISRCSVPVAQMCPV